MKRALNLTLCSIVSALIFAVACCGCASNRASQAWPINRMVDPVTEETPHVIIDK